jgi:hypothetical protein
MSPRIWCRSGFSHTDDEQTVALQLRASQGPDLGDLPLQTIASLFFTFAPLKLMLEFSPEHRPSDSCFKVEAQKDDIKLYSTSRDLLDPLDVKIGENVYDLNQAVLNIYKTELVTTYSQLVDPDLKFLQFFVRSRHRSVSQA